MQRSINSAPATLPPWQLAALAEKERRRRERAKSEGLLDFIPRIARGYAAPAHLAPLVDAFERAATTSVRAVGHAPPRHAKTDTALAFATWFLTRHPEKTVGYFTYGDALARSKSRKARAWAIAAGVQIAGDARNLSEWRTRQGGGMLAGGVSGPATGQGIDVLIVDDPYKNRVQAESEAYRNTLIDFWTDVGETRIEPGGSAFIFHTRWNSADLIGHLLGSDDAASWERYFFPAISREGTPLWGARWPLEDLEKKRQRVGEFTWASLYQGEPRPRGGAVFSGPTVLYSALPTTGYRVAIGLDLAYTERTSADYSVAVVLAECDGRFYILDVLRLQVPAPAFGDRLALLSAQYRGAPLVWYASGTEMGAAQFYRRGGLDVTVRAPKGDKFTRAIETAAAWNRGDILLPDPVAHPMTKWSDDFLGEVRAFTGTRDAHDDQIDAIVAAFDYLNAGGGDATVYRIRSSRR